MQGGSVPSLTAVAEVGAIEIDRALEGAERGLGHAMVILGPAGTGKSTLLGEAVRAARSRGFTVSSVRGDPAGSERDGAAIESLLARLGGEYVPDRALELIDSACLGAPLALIVDDAHFTDDRSLELLTELGDVIAARPLLLMIAAREHLLSGSQRRTIGRLAAVADATRMTLQPLTAKQAAQVIRRSIPDATDEFCRSCAELSGGNPFLLTELATWAAAHRLELTGEAIHAALEPLPPLTVRRFYADQLEELERDTAAVGVAYAIAISEQEPGLEEISRLAALPTDAVVTALDTLLAAAIVAPGEPVRFACPLTAPCLQGIVPKPLAAELRRRAAAIADDQGQSTEVQAGQLMLAPATGDPRIVEELMELADEASRRGSPEQARALIDRAIGEGVEDPDVRSRLLVRLGQLNLLVGREESAAPLATGVAGLKREDERADGLLTLGVAQLEAGSPRAAALSFAQATDLIPTDEPLRTRAEINTLLTDLLVPERREQARGRIDSLLEHPHVDSQPWGPDLMLGKAWLQLLEGAPGDHTIELVRAAVEAHDADSRFLGDYFHTLAATALAVLDEFGQAEQVVHDATATARRAGSVPAERNLQLAHALTLRQAGRVAECAERCPQLLAATGEEAKFNRSLASAVQASVLLELARQADASAAVTDALGWTRHELPRLMLLETKARLSLARDQLADALATAHEVEHLARQLGIVNPALSAWEPLAASCYQRAGEPRRANGLADQAVETAARFGAPSATALALRVKAAVVGPPRDEPYLKRAYEAVQDSSGTLEKAKVLIEYANLLHRNRSSERARMMLRDGIDLAARLGARRTAERGTIALVAAGGRPRRKRLTGPQALTPAERRIAELARSGETNSEIAETLVITRKTVEWHLTKAYRKLRIASRDELTAALNDT